MHLDNWPKPPIWPEELPIIRERLTEEEYAELLRRMVQVYGPLLGYPQAFGEQELKAPNAARTLGALRRSSGWKKGRPTKEPPQADQRVRPSPCRCTVVLLHHRAHSNFDDVIVWAR